MHNSTIVRVKIPEIATPSSRRNFVSSEKQIQQNTSKIESLQQPVDETILSSGTTAATIGNSNLAIPSPADLESLKYKPIDIAPKKVDGLIDSILQKFPPGDPVTITFVGCKTDGETDKVTADVAHRLADRQGGKVLLIDSNPSSRALTKNRNATGSEGVGNVLCDNEPRWQDLVQMDLTNELDFLPYGNVKTAKILRSRTAEFLEHTKEIYQFICVSVGLNESPIAKSFCNAADGIYLLIDLNQTTHTEAKVVADKFKLNNQPLVGCIALGGTQESK